MNLRRGPVHAAVGMLGILSLVAVMAATKPSSPAGAATRRPQPSQQPPSETSGTPLAALVDDFGAAILLSGPRGTTSLAGVYRDRARSWKVALPKNSIPLGCTQCPATLVGSKSGSLRLVSGGEFAPFDTRGLELNNAIGLPGLASVLQFTALATNRHGGIGLDLLSSPASAHLNPGTGPVLPLTPFQQTHSVIAISADGRSAAAIAIRGILDPGRWRLVATHDGKVVVDDVVTAQSPRADAAPNAAACLSPDGTSLAFVLPARGGGFEVQMRRGGRVVTVRVPSAVQAQACDLGATLSVATYDSQEHLWLGRYLLATGALVKQLPISGDVSSVQFCPGTGQAVIQSGNRTIVTKDRWRRTRKIESTTLSGCTTTGTPWFVGDRRVSWLTGK